MVEIYFGTKNDFRYWFTKIDIPVKIPIGTSPVILTRLAGGAYNKMVRQDVENGEAQYVFLTPAPDLVLLQKQA